VVTGTGLIMKLQEVLVPIRYPLLFRLGCLFFSRIILESTKFLVIPNLIIVFNISYRGMVTFFAWGMITGFLMISCYWYSFILNPIIGKVKLNYIIVIIALAMISIWSYTSVQTGGLINKRQNQMRQEG
jgi:hypothetical protein